MGNYGYLRLPFTLIWALPTDRLGRAILASRALQLLLSQPVEVGFVRGFHSYPLRGRGRIK